MAKREWGGLTLPNLRGGITIRFWVIRDPDVAEHEWRVHVPQIERMGRVRYLVTYGWHWLRIVAKNRSFEGWHDEHPMER